MKIRIILSYILLVFMVFYKSCEKDPTSSNEIKTGTVSDIDGNVYQTVKIGNQWWMAENLKVTKYRNGDLIPKVIINTVWDTISIGAYGIYNNNDSIFDIYGGLYNWHAVNDSRNIAPIDWHIPTDEEWKQLELFLGICESDIDTIGYRGTYEGNYLKSETGWDNDGNGVDKYSFSVLPGGARNAGGDYLNIGIRAYFWSSSQNNSTSAWSRHLDCDSMKIARYYNRKDDGFTIRCVKD